MSEWIAFEVSAAISTVQPMSLSSVAWAFTASISAATSRINSSVEHQPEDQGVAMGLEDRL